MNRLDFAALATRSLEVRRQVLRLAARGGCFAGAALSCADLLVYLYGQRLSVTPASLASPERDYLLLSKGHAVPALYATLAEFGFVERRRLDRHLSTDDRIYWHPNADVPGVEFHSGSLGHSLSVGIGIAYDLRAAGGTNRVFVIAGDGELDEGSMWEGLLVAAALKLDNLVLVIDRNELQANTRTEALVPLEPLQRKLAAFGWQTAQASGHRFAELDAAFAQFDERRERPFALIAETVRGKGVPSLEGRADKWFVDATPEYARELEGELVANAESLQRELCAEAPGEKRP